MVCPPLLWSIYFLKSLKFSSVFDIPHSNSMKLFFFYCLCVFLISWKAGEMSEGQRWRWGLRETFLGVLLCTTRLIVVPMYENTLSIYFYFLHAHPIFTFWDVFVWTSNRGLSTRKSKYIFCLISSSQALELCTFSNLEKRLKIHHPNRFVLIVKCILHLRPSPWAGTVVAVVVGLCLLTLSLIYSELVIPFAQVTASLSAGFCLALQRWRAAVLVLAKKHTLRRADPGGLGLCAPVWRGQSRVHAEAQHTLPTERRRARRRLR